MKHRRMIFSSTVACLLVCSTGCIWFSDWDDDWLMEKIVYDNHTDYYIDCYIDDHYETTVRPYGERSVEDRDWDGRHLFYARSVDGEIEWGPEYFYLDDGETLVIDLHDSYWGTGDAAGTTHPSRLTRPDGLHQP